MAFSFNDNITFTDNTTLSSTSSLIATRKYASNETNTQRTLNQNSGWVTHITTTFTSTIPAPLRLEASFSLIFESSFFIFYSRFYLQRSSNGQVYTYEPGVNIGAQMNNNRGTGSEKISYVTDTLPADTYTLNLQVQNGSGATGYFIVGGYFGGIDRLGVYYY